MKAEATRTFYAHSLPGRPEPEWQLLEKHLKNVAEKAREFAEPFGGGEWAYLAGLWHDLGKYSDAFQQYLRAGTDTDPHRADSAARTDHSTAGAQHAADVIPPVGTFLAYLVAGHHAGLADGRDTSTSNLEVRLKKNVEPWTENSPDGLVGSLGATERMLSAHLIKGADAPFALAFWLRMLFSCLADADFLDTEAFMSPESSGARPSWPEHILARMETALQKRFEQFPPASTEIDRQREAIRAACLASAGRSPGLFTLTVPTGGGKTLSSMAFALHHAIRHGLRRIIYVIPFTSIIEQNAGEFRSVFARLANEIGRDPVLEHHSNLDPDDPDRVSTVSRLATENWNAPLVVTTNVRFFESLFANRASRCRKLHNVAGSVVILDEAQNLPVEYLDPCLRVLRELTAHYGASVVLCTATQPAVTAREEFPIGLDIPACREIIPDPVALYRERAFRRVEVTQEDVLTEECLVGRMRAEHQVLCIVNTRDHARRLFNLLGGQNAEHFHLSANMCPLHRTSKFREIRRRLFAGEPCRVVSTQLIEAGVDISFPCVYRAPCGLDSLAQAAGRCNRHGELRNREGEPIAGRVTAFQAEKAPPPGFLRQSADAAGQVIPLHDDALSLEAVEHFFRLHYWQQKDQWDAHGIIGCFPSLQSPFVFKFKTCAEAFLLIRDSQRPVVIPWRDGSDVSARVLALISRLRETHRCGIPPPANAARRLQQATISIPDRLWHELVAQGRIEEFHERFPVLVHPENDYDADTGIKLPGDPDDPEAFMG